MGYSQKKHLITDHLGNGRVWWRWVGDAATGAPEILQSADYYPFGHQHSNPDNLQIGIINQYKYNGKEFQPDFDLSWIDYGARFYDPIIGRWNVIDPLLERHYDFTPYAYVLNNPMIFTDPNGLTEFYGLNGKVVQSTEDGSDARKLVLEQGSKKAMAKAIDNGSFVDVPSVEVVEKMDETFEKTETTGNEHGFVVGQNETTSKVTEGTSGEWSPTGTGAAQDVVAQGDLKDYDIHSHPKGDNPTKTFGAALPSDPDKSAANNTSGNPNVVLGYMQVPSQPSASPSTISVATQPSAPELQRAVGYYNSQGLIHSSPISYSTFKRAVNRINSGKR